MSSTPAVPDHHKDACSYGVDLAKQFLTLASAGIAFIVGLILSTPKMIPFGWLIIILLLLAASMAFGLLFLMSVVGFIGRRAGYDVYTLRFRVLASVQIATFLLPIVLIGWFTLNYVADTAQTLDTPPVRLKISADGKTIEQPVFPQSDIELVVNKGAGFKFRVRPAR
jgi:hypothetical protein